MAALTAGLVLLRWFLLEFELSSWDFRNNLWAPAHLLVAGRSPYRIAVLFENSGAVWLPTVIGAFFPLGWLRLPVATNIWFLLNLACLIGTVVLTARPARPKPFVLGLLLILFFVFPPVVEHLRLGQMSLLIAFVVLAAAHLLDRVHPVVIALGLAVAIAKPQLLALALPGLLLAEQKRRKRGLVLAASVLAVGALLTLPLFASYPIWLGDFVLAQRANPTWEQPSSLFILRRSLGVGGIVIWAVLATGALAINAFLWLRREPSVAAVWSLALTPLVTPYVWSWDFVLILPLFARTAFRAARRRTLFLLAGGYLAIWFLIIRLLLAQETPSNFAFWWVPWSLVGTIMAAKLTDRRD